MYQFSNRNGKLSLQLYQRSADLFLGVPFNIASYALLTVILAHITGLKPGEFIHTFGDVHIYENHITQVKEQLSRTPRPFPTVALDPSVKTLDDFRPEHVSLYSYDPHPMLKAELTIAGGLMIPKQAKWLDSVMKSILTVGVVIIRDNKILLVREGEKSRHITGMYGMPAGSIESNETPIQATIRELKEETGLVAEEKDLFELPKKYEADIKRKDGTIHHFYHTVFVCKHFVGQIRAADDVQAEWVVLDQVKDLPLLPNIEDMIAEGKKYV